MQAVDIDTAAVRAVAGQFDAVAQTAARAAAAQLTFGVATAGRGYPSEGEAVRSLAARLVDELSDWVCAARDFSVELRCAADRYTESELTAGARIR